MTKALFVVDVQHWGFAGDWPLPNHEQLLKQIASRLQSARESGEAIVHIQNDGPAGEPDAPGERDWDLVFEVLPGELLVRKTTQNVFESNPELSETLRGLGVREVELVGAQSELCVLQTALGAHANGFKVTADPNLHGTYNGGWPGAEGGPSALELRDAAQLQISKLG